MEEIKPKLSKMNSFNRLYKVLLNFHFVLFRQGYQRVMITQYISSLKNQINTYKVRTRYLVNREFIMDLCQAIIYMLYIHNKQLDLVVQWKRVFVMDALNSTNYHDKNDIRLQKIKSILLQLCLSYNNFHNFSHFTR